MTLLTDVVGVAVGFLLPVGVSLRLARYWLSRQPSALPKAAERLAESLGWPCVALDAEERAVLSSLGFLRPTDALTHAAVWKQPDATFATLVVGRAGRSHGVVVVTPRDIPRKKLASLATRRLAQTREAPLPLGAKDVEAFRVNGRIVVRRPNVETADDLERLVAAACAILDA